ncbi:hypothetical protein SH139x_002868 [Planctomycetaceae bacterium SH139]
MLPESRFRPPFLQAFAVFTLLLVGNLAIAQQLTESSDSAVASSDAASSFSTKLAELPPLAAYPARPQADWLIDSSSFTARVGRLGDDKLALDNGLVRRVLCLAPNAATIALDNLITGQSLLRGVKPEAIVTIDGQRYHVGGLVGQPNYAYLTDGWLAAMSNDPAAFQLVDFHVGEPESRFHWQQRRHYAGNVKWPPPGVHLRLDFQHPQLESVTLSVHYELYDGIPLFSKWITIDNQSPEQILLDNFVSEQLAIVEEVSWVETRDGVEIPPPSSLHVETDFAFGGFNSENANRHVVHWRTDPQYSTQVNYLKSTPCLLEVSPTYGPAQRIAPAGAFSSCRAFELVFDSSQRERRGLAKRRMYRCLAPWVTENPLMHHLRVADPESTRQAIDQAAEVGFEMIILSFGSGFNMDNEDPKFLAEWKAIADYADSRGVELGSYSLLSSRAAPAENMIVSPAGSKPTHGQCPALTSPWGLAYLARLKKFYQTTGFDLLEHDGSYPGDVDVTPRPPLQQGEQDSRWVQWKLISDYYQWCRQQGIYLNVPDFYFLSGSNKCGMGYREVNWSLPRAMQVIHTRQNIYDGTWTKTPSMGWMFVPLSQYHGGGAAATIEPLHQHLDHYRRMLLNNLALGVQACYRGPRLYDTPETKQMVKSCVDWFKQHRQILESDLIHGRRADGRDLDWMLHVNPELPTKGMLLVFNPLDRPVTRTLSVNLYYTGLDEQAVVTDSCGAEQTLSLSRDYHVDLQVKVPAGEMSWFTIK